MTLTRHLQQNVPSSTPTSATSLLLNASCPPIVVLRSSNLAMLLHLVSSGFAFARRLPLHDLLVPILVRVHVLMHLSVSSSRNVVLVTHIHTPHTLYCTALNLCVSTSPSLSVTSSHAPARHASQTSTSPVTSAVCFLTLSCSRTRRYPLVRLPLDDHQCPFPAW